MGIYVDILQAGTNSHGVTVDDFNALATDILTDGVVGAITNTSGVAPTTGAFAVNAQGSPDMTVAVTAGTAYVTGTPTSGVSQRLRVNMDANQNVTIASNSTGSTRYDWIYISLNAAKMKDPAVDASDVATLVTSRSTSASTDNGTPPTYGYCIAVVTVANAAATIANASITDKRISIDHALKTDYMKLVNKQDNGSNSTVSNQLVQRGWGYVTGTGSYNHSEKTITLPVAFDDALYDVYLTVIGYKDGSNPTARTDVAAYATGASTSAQITNSSTFVVSISTAGNIAAATRILFSWKAVGTKAR